MSAVSQCNMFLETLRLEESDSSHLSRQPGPGDEWDTDLDTDGKPIMGTSADV